MLMAVAKASFIGEPVCMMILILKEQRYCETLALWDSLLSTCLPTDSVQTFTLR